LFRFPKRARRSIFNILIHFPWSPFLFLEERTNKTPKTRTSKLFGAVYIFLLLLMFFFILLLLLSSLSWAQQNSFLSFLFHTFIKPLYARRVQSVCRLVVLFFLFSRVCANSDRQHNNIRSILFFLFVLLIFIIILKRKKTHTIWISAWVPFFSFLFSS
jgi:hypothetical protein